MALSNHQKSPDNANTVFQPFKGSSCKASETDYLNLTMVLYFQPVSASCVLQSFYYAPRDEIYCFHYCSPSSDYKILQQFIEIQLCKEKSVLPLTWNSEMSSGILKVHAAYMSSTANLMTGGHES
jgi:hypothetical protein